MATATPIPPSFPPPHHHQLPRRSFLLLPFTSSLLHPLSSSSAPLPSPPITDRVYMDFPVGSCRGGLAAMSARLPRKWFYRARAHSNPLSDSHFPVPICPARVDYSSHYPRFFPFPLPAHAHAAPSPRPKVRFADVGCGFGSLLVDLSPLFPDTLMIGMEPRSLPLPLSALDNVGQRHD